MLKKFIHHPILYFALLGLTIAVFLYLAFTYAHQLPSRVDEGSFLIKGYYYLSGKYFPFEDYGPWTNNMPLAYYIPGIAQYLFGPSLKVARYFMIFLTLLNFAGLYLLVFRLKGKWWALFSILPLAINPALVSMYVQAVSEGVVACLLVWMLYFLIGNERKDWQIAVGAMLSALVVLTRQNMVLLVPFAVIYAYWLHGKRAGRIALVSAALPLIIAHIVYYPHISDLWFTWLPASIRRAFNIKIVEGGGTQTWRPDVEPFSRITSFFMTLRYHFVPFFGFYLSIIALPFKKFWTSEYERKLVFLLSATFLILFGMHAWASLGKNYCVFCFSNYLSFFNVMAVLAGVITITNFLSTKEGNILLPLVVFFLIALPSSFLGSLETVGRQVMALPFPRLKGGAILQGSTELWKIFENRFGWSYEQLLHIIPPVFGLLATVLLLVILIGSYHLLKKRIGTSLDNYLLIAMLAVSIVLTPTYILGGDKFGNPCGGDVLTAYETVGAQLQALIPDGSKVYWGGSSEVTPLLYIVNAQLHPPQFNGIYSKRRGGDRDLLEKKGYYNEESIRAWRAEDEFLLVGNIYMGDFWKDFLNPEDFNEYEHTSPLNPCDPDSFIRIYRRK